MWDEWIETAMGLRIRISEILAYEKDPYDNYTKCNHAKGFYAVTATPEEIDALLGREQPYSQKKRKHEETDYIQPKCHGDYGHIYFGEKMK